MIDYRNILILDKARWDQIGQTFDLLTILDLVVIIDDQNETFSLIKNRYRPQSKDVPSAYLETFLTDYSAKLFEATCKYPDPVDDDDLPF